MMRPTTHRSRLAAGIVLGTAVLLAGCAANALADETSLTAQKLAQKYATDPKGFDAQYKDKVVEVEGVVQFPDVKESLSDAHWLTMNGYTKPGDNIDTIVRCKMIPAFADLRKGQKIKVKGKCQGYRDTVLAVSLVDCELVSGK
jgi:hypothetical protein